MLELKRKMCPIKIYFFNKLSYGYGLYFERIHPNLEWSKNDNISVDFFIK